VLCSIFLGVVIKFSLWGLVRFGSTFTFWIISTHKNSFHVLFLSIPLKQRNVAPKGRTARKPRQDKEKLEKERLRNRTGGFVRNDPVDNPFAVAKGSPMYMDGKNICWKV